MPMTNATIENRPISAQELTAFYLIYKSLPGNASKSEEDFKGEYFAHVDKFVKIAQEKR